MDYAPLRTLRTMPRVEPSPSSSSRPPDRMSRVAGRLARLQLSRQAGLAVAVLLLIAAGVGDAITPSATTFTLLYVVPLGVAVWYVSLPLAYLVGVAAVVAHAASTMIDLPGLTPGFLLWNAAADLTLYVAFALLLASLRRQIDLEVSARQNALGQLRHAERLATLGKLASGIAHEVGTPLNVISGHAELIATGALSGEPAAASARVIIKQSERVASIIRQLLDFARRGGTRVERTDLTSLVRHTVLMLGPIASKAAVQIELSGPLVEANVNASEMQQVVTNLLTNAVHAMSHGGTIEVSVSVEVTSDPRHPARGRREWAVIRVHDHGDGIPPEILPRIFEPFFTTRDVGVGTGLGLAVVYGIVQDHGGFIDVATAPGRGTTMSLYLPR